jgi:hypothetical protein
LLQLRQNFAQRKEQKSFFIGFRILERVGIVSRVGAGVCDVSITSNTHSTRFGKESSLMNTAKNAQRKSEKSISVFRRFFPPFPVFFPFFFPFLRLFSICFILLIFFI